MKFSHLCGALSITLLWYILRLIFLRLRIEFCGDANKPSDAGRGSRKSFLFFLMKLLTLKKLKKSLLFRHILSRLLKQKVKKILLFLFLILFLKKTELTFLILLME